MNLVVYLFTLDLANQPREEWHHNNNCLMQKAYFCLVNEITRYRIIFAQLLYMYKKSFLTYRVA